MATTTPSPEPPPTYEAAVTAAIDHLEQAGYIDRDQVAGGAMLNAAGIDTFVRLVVFWIAYTAGDDNPPAIKLTNAVGQAFRESLGAAFAHVADDIDTATEQKAIRDTVQLLRRANRDHSY